MNSYISSNDHHRLSRIANHDYSQSSLDTSKKQISSALIEDDIKDMFH